MNKWLTCLLVVLMSNVVCIGTFTTSNDDPEDFLAQIPPICYVDTNSTCADAIISLHLEGQLPPGVALACGNCEQSAITGNWSCPNSNQVVPAVVDNRNLPFARRHQEFEGNGSGVGGKVGVQDGQNPIDCGRTITCTVGCVEISVGGGPSVRACGSNPLSDNMPIMPRFANGQSCRAFPNPIVVLGPN